MRSPHQLGNNDLSARNGRLYETYRQLCGVEFVYDDGGTRFSRPPDLAAKEISICICRRQKFDTDDETKC